jgi:hypothetical protein
MGVDGARTRPARAPAVLTEGARPGQFDPRYIQRRGLLYAVKTPSSATFAERMRSKSVDGSASKAGRRGVLRRRICFRGGWRIIWLERGREMKALEVGFDREPGRVRKQT